MRRGWALPIKFLNLVSRANAQPLRDTAAPPPDRQKLKSLVKVSPGKNMDQHELTDTAYEAESGANRSGSGFGMTESL